MKITIFYLLLICAFTTKAQSRYAFYKPVDAMNTVLNKNMKKLITCIVLLIQMISFSQKSTAEAPCVEWMIKIGNSDLNTEKSIQQTTDGGYIVIGNTYSNEGEGMSHHGGSDIWVLKLTNRGEMQWEKTLGGSKDEFASSINQTKEGGYIIAGTTMSIDGDITNKIEENGTDYWVIKLVANGNIQWQKVFGGDSYDDATDVQETADGGFIVVGSSRSNFKNEKREGLLDGFNDENWVVKLDKNGNLKWQKLFGGKGYESPQSIQQTTDKGFIIVGFANNNTISSASNYNFSIIKLNEAGDIQWQKSLGGSNDDYANCVQQTKDGGYIIGGTTQSIDGDVINTTGGGKDFWILKLNSIGDFLWQKAFGETANDELYSLQQTKDGGYIMAGSHGVKDIDGIAIKLDDKGNIEWKKSIGGSDYDDFRSIVQTKDNGYIIVGKSNSTDEDLKNIYSENSGFWIIKLK